ncbi:hypothetical protein ZIOFF_053213 [Zingiber officinale]|uniref:Multiple C2 domain-containing protein n=1 Tax=Zingiber officinale TaxID=94328 RepID=A0A8J5FSE3_ZINOF|nr:hypothetical protein ZIOFF_053213 [Zingiber officinale]
MFEPTSDRQDYRIGKVQVSTLESNRVYTNSYPLLQLLWSGVKKMGEVQLAVRFACTALLPDTCAMYALPMLPRMHYLKAIGVVHQEAVEESHHHGVGPCAAPATGVVPRVGGAHDDALLVPDQGLVPSFQASSAIPSGMDTRLSQEDTVEANELEFDPMPSMKPPEVVRAQDDRLRTVAGRVLRVMGDFATQGERVQALVVAVALGFYFLRHPIFRNPMPWASLNFFRRLPSLSDQLL